MDVLRHITENQDVSFTKNIKVSSFLEGSRTHEALPQETQGGAMEQKVAKKVVKKVVKRVRGGFKTMVSCILSEYDPMYQGLNPNERALYLRQRCLEVSGSLDEDETNYYTKYQFNPKIMGKKLIQRSLQSSDKDTTLSSILYLNEYYQKHFHLVSNNIVYETTLKPYPKVYISYETGTYRVVEPHQDWVPTLTPEIPISSDLKKANRKYIFVTPIGPISKYKVDDLKLLASDNGVSLTYSNGKSKNKQELYNAIVEYFISQL